MQLAATADSIVDGEAAGEIDAQTATTARTKVLLAEGFLTGARDILADPDVGPVGQRLAQTLIGIADKTLDDALVILK